MRIGVLTESRADLGGLDPLIKINPEIEIVNIWQEDEDKQISWRDIVSLDWLIVLGDRRRVLEFVIQTADICKNTGIAHLSGGDKQNGNLVDEAVRHSLSKFAHVHFPCTTVSAQRLIRHGEDPARIHVVGSTFVDSLKDFVPEKNKIALSYNLILIHPSFGWEELLKEAMKRDRFCKVLAPNNDFGFGEGLWSDLSEYIPNMSREEFLQELWNCKRFIGNSSALYLEAQYLGTPCYQVGERNLGRQEAFPGHINSGKDVRTETGLRKDWNLGAHGDGRASEQILDVLGLLGKPNQEFLHKEWV